MKWKEFKEKHLLTITIFIAVVAICAGVIAYKNYTDYEKFKKNKYQTEENRKRESIPESNEI